MTRLHSLRNSNVSDAGATDAPLNEVEAKLERVNQLWMRIERKLLTRQPPRPITVVAYGTLAGEYGDYTERHFLGIQKSHGKWRLVHAVDFPQEDESDIPDNLSWKPLVESDLDTRINLAQYISKLQDEVDNTRTRFLPRLDETISRLEESLDAE